MQKPKTLVATFRESLTNIKGSTLQSDLHTEQGYINRAKRYPAMREYKFIEFNHYDARYNTPYKVVEVATGKAVK